LSTGEENKGLSEEGKTKMSLFYVVGDRKLVKMLAISVTSLFLPR